MSKLPGHLDLVSKRDKKKHFSHELGGGKGDCPRSFSKTGDDAYRNNSFWDKCKEKQQSNSMVESSNHFKSI